MIDANGNKSQVLYDLAGRAVQSINPNGKIVNTAYDALDRPVSVTDAMGYQTQFAYDPNGNVTSITDANKETLSKQYDELNRVKVETDALNATTQYSYDLLGNVTSITDANGNTTYFDFDDLGRLVTVRDPLYVSTGRATTFTYDEAGNVLTKSSRSGAQAATGNVPDQGFRYDFQYDQKNRLTQKTDGRVGKSISFAYDNVGNISSKTNYDGTVTQYRYDDANRLVAEQNQGYVEVSYQYDGAGRLLNRVLSNGAITSYTWDDDNRLASLSNTTVTGVVNSAAYQRDNVGNITNRTDSSGVTNFTYDANYRLTSTSYSNPAYNQYNQGFTYDKAGNRLTITEGGNTPLYYIYDADNRLNSIHKGNAAGPLQNSFVYDYDGNLVSKTDGSGTALGSLSYDAKDRVTSITAGGLTDTFSYDPYDYRISKTDSGGSLVYLLDGEKVDAIMAGSLWRARYMRGVVIDEVVNGYQYDTNGAWTNYTFHHDNLQSVVGLSGHDGTILQTITYGAFGDEQSTTGAANGNCLHYTGREEDPDSGVYYYRARYYDRTLGIFTSEDPKGFAAGVNFYAYAKNNPINANDPTGEIPLPLITGGIGFFVGGLGNAGAQIYHNGGFNNFSWTDMGIAAGTGLVAGAAAPIVATTYVGAALLGGTANVVQTAATNVTNGKNVTDGLLASGLTGTVAGIVAGPIDILPGLYDAASPWLDSSVASFLNGQGQIAANVTKSTLFRNAGGAIVSNAFGDEGDSSSATAGGFVIYPNKPNNNMMQAVYKK